MDRNPCDSIGGNLDFASVHTCANVNAEASHRESDRAGAPDGPGWPVECRKEPIAGGVDFAPTKAREFVSHDLVVIRLQLPPSLIAQCHDALGGADDVCEENGSKYAVRCRTMPDTREKLLNFVDLWIESLRGTVAPRYLIFHASLAIFFLFATVKVLESRKWK